MSLRAGSLVLLAAAVACGSGLRGAPGDRPAAPTSPPPVANPAVSEATLATAGAERCTVGEPSPLGPALPRVAYAVAFGAAGGLVVWQAPDGLWLRPLGDEGRPRGEARRLSLPTVAEPTHVVAVDGGFVVVASEPLTRLGACAPRCSDPGCADAVAGTCPRLVGYRTVLARVRIDGSVDGAPRTLELGSEPVVAVTPAQGTRFALLTAGGILAMVSAGPGGEWSLAVRPVTVLPGILPVRGPGPPTLLLLGEGGDWIVLDAEGEHRIEVGEKTSLREERPLARHGADGLVHVAWWVPVLSVASVQTAVIAAGRLRRVGEPQSTLYEVEAPFSSYVFAYSYPGGRVERRRWPAGAVGRAVELAAADPGMRGTPLIEWTGSRFVALYVGLDGGERTLRALPFDCAP